MPWDAGPLVDRVLEGFTPVLVISYSRKDIDLVHRIRLELRETFRIVSDRWTHFN